MKAYPFLVATGASVSFSPPMLNLFGVKYEPLEPVSKWDYGSPFSVEATVTIDRRRFSEETRLDLDTSLLAVVQVDCVSTGFRALGCREILDEDCSGLTLKCEIPAGRVADSVSVGMSVLLNSQMARDLTCPRAYEKGSILFESRRPAVFLLEGNGSSFPTQAVSFINQGLPAGAAWWLRYSPTELEQPFLSATRLYLNTDHARAAGLASGADDLAKSVLRYDVVVQLLQRTSVVFESSDVEDSLPDGSVGKVLENMTRSYLGMSLGASLDLLRCDPTEFYARLQDSTSFLEPRG